MVALAGARLLSVLAVFLAGVVAARLLSTDAVGVAGVGLTVGWAVAIVANGGLNISAIYFLGKRPEQRVRLVGLVLGLALLSFLVAILVTAGLAPLLGVLVLDGQRPLLFVVSAAVSVGTVAHEVAGALLLGLSRRGSYVLADLLRSSVTLAGTALVLGFLLRSAEGYVLASAFGLVVPAMVSLVLVRRTVGTLRPGYDRRFGAEALRMGLAGQAGNVLTFMNVRVDQLLVPALAGLHAGGVYFIAARVADAVGQVSTAASSMLFPHVAAQSEERDTTTTERTTRLTLLATSAMAVALGVLAPVGLPLLFGADYAAGVPALLLLLVAMLPLALTRVLAADLKGRGRPGLVSIGTGVGVLLVLGLDLVLIPAYGIEGAAMAAVVAQLSTTLVLLVCYRRITGGRIGALLPRPSDIGDVVALVRGRLSGVST